MHLSTGTGAAVLFSTVSALVGRYLPPIYMQAVLLGKGSAGLVVVSIRILTKGALPQTPEGSCRSFIAIGQEFDRSLMC